MQLTEVQLLFAYLFVSSDLDNQNKDEDGEGDDFASELVDYDEAEPRHGVVLVEPEVIRRPNHGHSQKNN